MTVDLNNLKHRIGSLMAAIGEGCTNAEVTAAIMQEIRSVFSDGRVALDHFGNNDCNDLSKREQTPEDLAHRDRKPSPVACVHCGRSEVGTPPDEPVHVGDMHQESPALESRLTKEDARTILHGLLPDGPSPSSLTPKGKVELRQAVDLILDIRQTVPLPKLTKDQRQYLDRIVETERNPDLDIKLGART